MKKILLSSAVLTFFAFSILLFQLSCQKNANAQTTSPNYVLPPATTTTLGGVTVDGTTIKVDANGKISLVSSLASASFIVYSKTNTSGNDEIWKANIDGSNQRILNINLPSGYTLNVNHDGGQIRITSDKQKIIFKGENSSTISLFSCAVDGTNVIRLIDGIGTTFDVD